MKDAINWVSGRALPLSSVLMRGLKRRCPECGEGHAFQGYLKQAESCSVCGEEIGKIRADDGPTWLTLLIVGHILAPFMIWGMSQRAVTYFGFYGLAAMWSAVAVALCLLFLPFMKGLFLAIIWRVKAPGAGSSAAKESSPKAD